MRFKFEGSPDPAAPKALFLVLELPVVVSVSGRFLLPGCSGRVLEGAYGLVNVSDVFSNVFEQKENTKMAYVIVSVENNKL